MGRGKHGRTRANDGGAGVWLALIAVVAGAAVLFAVSTGLAAEPKVDALKRAVNESGAIDAGYYLWQHYYTQGNATEADVWWQKAKANATAALAKATTEKTKGIVELQILNARWRRAGVISTSAPSDAERVTILQTMLSADAADPWLARSLWLAKAKAGKPATEVEAAWNAAVTTVNATLAATQTEGTKRVIRDRRANMYLTRFSQVVRGSGSGTAAKAVLAKLETLLDGTSASRGAFCARQLSLKYAGLGDWPKAVQWAKDAAARHLALHPDGKYGGADLSVGGALRAYTDATRKDASLKAGLKAYADWSAAWVDAHGTLRTPSVTAALPDAYARAGDHTKARDRYLQYLAKAMAHAGTITNETKQAAAWREVDEHTHEWLFRQRLVMQSAADQRAGLVAHADAIRALAVAPNDRRGLLYPVMLTYEAARETAKATALFDVLIAKAGAEATATPGDASNERVAGLLKGRIAYVLSCIPAKEKASDDVVALVDGFAALLDAHKDEACFNTFRAVATMGRLSYAYDRLRQYDKADAWHLKFLPKALVELAKIADETEREKAGAYIDKTFADRWWTMTVRSHDESALRTLETYADSARAIMVPPNDRTGSLKPLMQIYRLVENHSKAKAIFDVVDARAKAESGEEADRKVAGLLRARVAFLNNTGKKTEAVATLNKLAAMVQEKAHLASYSEAVWKAYGYLEQRDQCDAWYARTRTYDVETYSSETDAARRAALYRRLKENLVFRLWQLRPQDRPEVKQAVFTDLQKELRPLESAEDLLCLRRAYASLGQSKTVAKQIAAYEDQLIAAAGSDAEKRMALVRYFWLRAADDRRDYDELMALPSLQKALAVCPDDASRLETYRRIAKAYCLVWRFDDAKRLLRSVAGQFDTEPEKTGAANLVAWVDSERQRIALRNAERTVRARIDSLDDIIWNLKADIVLAQRKNDTDKIGALQQEIDKYQAERDTLAAGLL